MQAIDVKVPSKKSDPQDMLSRPLATILTPVYNEEAIIESHLYRLYNYMTSLEKSYRWELIIVNDGSTDETGRLADKFAWEKPNVKVYHHKINRNLGGAIQTGFKHASGDFIVVLDIDLSYSEDHIERLLSAIRETEADIVVASPYMKGGKNSAVPTSRLLLSRSANRLLRFMSIGTIHTFTGMVRAYRKDFIRNLNLKSSTYSINPEIIYKGMVLRASIVEIPAHLDWSEQQKLRKSRASGIRIRQGILASLMSGFIFRPYAFFMIIGAGLLLIALYVIGWIFYHSFGELSAIPLDFGNFEERFGLAVANVFKERPYSFMVGGIALIVALQFLGIGFLSLQNKRYFEELFHINTTILRRCVDNSTGSKDHK